MNDPWDVKSVRQLGQYVSCMKINGVPLLPPVLSKECRKEMQYYKLLAKEVEKRISVLKPYVIESDSDSSEDKTDAPELPENEQTDELPQELMCTSDVEEIPKERLPLLDTTNFQPVSDIYNSITSNITVVKTSEADSCTNSPKFVIDLSLNINENTRVLDSVKRSPPHSPTVDLPERDYNCLKKINQKELLTDVETCKKTKQKDVINELVNFSFSVEKGELSDPFPDIPLNQDGPSSLSSKSFTGSLNNIHTESMKESQIAPKLIRQRSYTLLKPSPQLLAHLEVQSISTGVEMTSISMSESLSNLSTPGKKRRSWDLETAKVKWSSMALELKQKNVPNIPKTNGVNKTLLVKSAKKAIQPSPQRSKSVVPEKPRRGSLPPKTLPKSEPMQKAKKPLSPVRTTPPNRAHPPQNTQTQQNIQKEETAQKQPPPVISESEDPATRVRELYEKIQKQQLLQMASLVEKQKREQMLLQQVFEEQNNLLFKQLKTICPKSPVEVKEAWGDKVQDSAERGPVSLSQLINPKSTENSAHSSPVSATLTETNNYINHCDNVLRKSRDITGSLKKQQIKPRIQNGTKTQSPKMPSEGSRTRTHSPNHKMPTSRKLNYDTSASSDREYEPILTDRTNDTMADLNVTFPSDPSDDGHSYNRSMMNHLCGKEVTMVHQSPVSMTGLVGMHCQSTDSAIRNMEETIQNSINSMCRTTKHSSFNCQPTPKERAAASKIVAHAKGYLVRRLMSTERVQGTVQTIRDALLCALQLHQDREGIRGADVDLHRRLIQQITAACYSLHDTFITSTPAERCAMIAADRGRRRSLAARQPTPRSYRQTDI